MGGLDSKFDSDVFPEILRGTFKEDEWENYLEKINCDLRKFRWKKKDVALLLTAFPTAFLTLIPWTLRQMKHTKRQNKYLRACAKEFNAKYGPTLKMSWSLEQQRMSLTKCEPEFLF